MGVIFQFKQSKQFDLLHYLQIYEQITQPLNLTSVNKSQDIAGRYNYC